MRQFFKFVFATLVGLILFWVVGFFLLAAIVAGVSSSSEKKATIESNSVLKLDLNYAVPEQTVNNPFAAFDFQTFKPKKATGLTEICDALKKAATDKNIKGIYIELGVNTNGLATLEVLRDQIKEFKKSGKFVYAYGETVSQKSYYLSTVADKIFLNPSGGMELTGFGREIMYYKNAFEKAGIEVQDFHCGAFKSAIEPYLRDKMSEPNRAQLMNIYGDVYHHFLTQIATDRKIDTATLNNAINNLQGWLPEEAKDLKLIDQTAYYDEVLAAMKEKVGIAKKEDLKLIEVAKYVTTLEKNVESGNKIAVVYAEGEIVGGDGDDGQIGGEKYAKLIRKLRLDDKVKAIVLRVNSPGGSALASDVMWRELVLAKKDKPLVVSFGDVAASGGYFIACMGDRIFAQPNTITGSIGVFGLIPNAKKLLNDKLGITTDKVQVTEHGAMSLGTNPLNEAEKAVIQRSIEKTYREFKLRVAEGRKLDTAYIETIAQGHVWTGNQGIENKLVDEIGGLDAAIKYAATKANLKDFRTKSYPEEKDWKAQLTESLGDAKASIIKSEIGEEQYKIYKTIKNITHTTGIQMRMPMEFDL